MMRASVRWGLIYLLEAVALLLALAIFALGAAMWRLSQGPVELELFRSQAQAQLADIFEGEFVALGRLEARYVADGGYIRISAHDVAVAEADGDVVVRAPVIELGMALDQLALGRLALIDANVVGGSVALVRRADGAIGAGLGSVARVAAQAERASGGGFDAQRLFETLRDPRNGPDAIARLRRVRIENASLRLVDEVTGLSFIVDEARASYLRNASGLQLDMSGLVVTSSGFAPISLQLDAGADLDRLFLDMQARNLSPRALAPQQGRMAAISAVDAPIDLSVQIDAEAGFGLRQARFELTARDGSIEVGDTVGRFRGARLSASFDPAAGALRIREASLDSDVLEASFAGRISNMRDYVGALPTRGDFELLSPGGRLDLDGVFEAPPEWTMIDAAGEIDIAERRAEFDWLNLDIGAAGLRVSGEGFLSQTEDGRWLPNLRLSGPITGVFGPRDALVYWPLALADGAREWVDERVIDARVTNVRLDVDLNAGAIEAGVLDNERLTLSFDFSNASFRYISTMTPVTDGAGSAILRGNAFEAVMTQGRIGDLELIEGVADIPRLNPKGALARFAGRGRGSAEDMLHLIDEEPMGFPTEYGVDPASIGGAGLIEFAILRPMYSEVPPEDILYEIDGVFSDISAPTGFGDLALTDAVVTLTANNEQLTAEGDGLLLGAPVSLYWIEDFGLEEGAPSTRFEIGADIDARTFDALGLPVRRFLDGPMRVEAATRGDGLDFTSIELTADLAEAAIELPGGVWSKPPGLAAQGDLTFLLNAEGGASIAELSARSDGLEFDGRVEVDPERGPTLLRLDRLYVDGAMDMTGRVALEEEGGLDVRLEGGYLDARDLVSQLLQPSEGEPFGVAMSLDIDLDRVLFSDAIALSEVALTAQTGRQGVRRFSFGGQGESGEVEARFAAVEEGGAREFYMAAPSAGRLLGLFGWPDYAVGGEVRMLGEAPPYGSEGALSARLEVTDLTLVQAPILARILAAGSLEGLGALLSGEGIAFDRIDGDILWEDGLLTLGEFRAAGPSLGVTGAGAVDFGGRQAGVDGTIVPAYTLNSFLGGIPLIGGLLVSRPGEGVIGVTFSVEGPFDGVTVIANPLSALAPGVLRRIFEGAAGDRAIDLRERRNVDPLEPPVDLGEAEDGPEPE